MKWPNYEMSMNKLIVSHSELPVKSCYKWGRVILEVALYENSIMIFSCYNRGRVILGVALFWGLYGMFPTQKFSRKNFV